MIDAAIFYAACGLGLWSVSYLLWALGRTLAGRMSLKDWRGVDPPATRKAARAFGLLPLALRRVSRSLGIA